MNDSRVTARRQAFACAGLVMILAGCSSLSAPPADYPVIYYEIGDSWTALKRSLHLYKCRSGAKVCTGPASYLNVTYHCRCD